MAETNGSSGSLHEILVDALGGKCKSCGGVDDLEVDHILPKSKGGLDKFDNAQLLCRECHRKKHGSNWGRPAKVQTEEWTRGQRCPKCAGHRGKVIAHMSKLMIKGLPYERFTHRLETAKGKKRIYCYQRLTPDPRAWE